MVSAKNILIVSSEPGLLSRFRAYLPAREYDVYCTSITDDRLKSIIETGSPDLIVVGREIPNLQCVELSLRIRRWTPTPILVLATANTLDNEVRAMDFQSDDYLSEPFNIAIVIERINQILSADRLNR
jgi:two-component system, OmpR family, KDP operon response regulator KdpE